GANGCAGDAAPVITSTPNTAATEGVTWFYPAMAKDADGDPLTWSLPIGPAGMTISPAGLVSWTPGPTSAGTVQVAVQVDDPKGAFFRQVFNVVVAPVNSAPKFVSTPPLFGVAGTLYHYTAIAEDPDDTALAFTVTGPAGMTV